MKTFSAEELKAKAAEVFQAYPKSQKVAVTTDGMAFIVDNGDNAVQTYSKKNRYGKELKISTFTRDDIEGSTTSGTEKTAKELLAVIEAETEATILENLIVLEKAGKNRKSVIEAAEKKLETIKAAE